MMQKCPYDYFQPSKLPTETDYGATSMANCSKNDGKEGVSDLLHNFVLAWLSEAN